jgi:hypothetical protein
MEVHMKTIIKIWTPPTALIVVTFMLLTSLVTTAPVQAQENNPHAPEEPVRLIFIHHSTGENWLMDDYGNLGSSLNANNYFISDTNYGWGPQGIGDATDIVNWPEWFGPQRSDRVLSALYGETEQNSWYTRSLANPGGENEIIMFKSCFPNSDLWGNPDDPPTPGDYDYSVGSSKYIYNLLLDYFITRPDKMFVAITAPPLSDSTNAANARAFNNWLVYDWLADYPGSNVFVFDFYNVLTGTDNHHRYNNGNIEHITDRGSNTNHYPSGGGDDHPTAAGSQKATDEFVPLLNIWFHQWRSSESYVPPVHTESEPNSEEETQADDTSGEQAAEEHADQPGQTQLTGALIDDFEPSAEGWFSTADDALGSILYCAADHDITHSGQAALHIQFEMAPDGYGGCGQSFEVPLNLSSGDGLTFMLRTDAPETDITLSMITGETYEPFDYYFPAPGGDSWKQISVPWNDFVVASWAESENAKLDPSHVVGIAFDLEGGADGHDGNLWIDDLMIISDGAPVVDSDVDQSPAEDTQTDSQLPPTAEEEEAEDGGRGGMCPLSTAIPFGTVAAVFFLRKRQTI